MTIAPASIEQPDGVLRMPVFRRSHDPVVIERVLRKHALGSLIPAFPRRFLRSAVRELVATSPRVYFVVAELDGIVCGFALAQTIGPTMWRRFARANLLRHPFAIAWIVLRHKIFTPIAGQLRRSRTVDRSRITAGRISQELDIPRVDRPFSWTSWAGNRPDVGQVDALFVCDSCRGRRVASGLLRFVQKEMTSSGVTLIEAHVDGTNIASLRAFRSAGWDACETAGGEFYVSIHTHGDHTKSQDRQRSEYICPPAIS
jgi:hypothetical protein